jgi:hypothetical protein
MSHQVILARHLLCRKSEGESYSEGKTFWYGDDDDGNRGDKDLEEVLAFLFACFVVVGEFGEEFDEQDEEEKKTSCATKLRDIPYPVSMYLIIGRIDLPARRLSLAWRGVKPGSSRSDIMVFP